MLSMDGFLTWLRWTLAKRKAAAFGRPKFLGRGFVVGPNVRIGGGASIGHDVRIDGDIDIGDNATLEGGTLLLGSITAGVNVVIGRFSYVGTGPQGRITIGANAYINDFSKVGAMERVTIGDHCIFAAFIQITDGEHGMDTDQHVIYAPISSAPVQIGEGVWLGSHVVVLKGTTIGQRSVIGAHSLVNADIPENAIAFGVPARVRSSRPTRS